MGHPGEKVSDEKHRISVAVKEEALSFLDEEGNLYRRTHEELHKASYRPG